MDYHSLGLGDGVVLVDEIGDLSAFEHDVLKCVLVLYDLDLACKFAVKYFTESCGDFKIKGEEGFGVFKVA